VPGVPGTWIAGIAALPDPGSAYPSLKESLMNWDRIAGNWKQLKGKVKEQWGRLTDDSLDVIAGRRDQLVGKIQESYGISRDEAERQVRDWEKTAVVDDTATTRS
jgi:uncharacterized protein YjbJ (UPF0337 family)